MRSNAGTMLSLGLLVLAAAAPAHAQQARDTLRLAALDSAVVIYTDPWGISHIYARTQHDLFFAQGWNVARDRLFQLEVWRRQATGTMAEIQGERALDRDIGARLLRFRGDLDAELRWYHPDGPSIVRAFVEGINAYIDRTRSYPELLPPEFAWLGIRPRHWTPEVVVSRHNGLFRNVGDEVFNLRLVRALGAERAREVLDLEPGRPPLRPDSALPDSVPERALRVYRASREPVEWRGQDLLPEYRAAHGAVPRGDAGVRRGAADARGPGPAREGSNNWAVAGRLTLTGRPMLANDPHRSLTLPSLRYWVHLVAPGWNVVGGGEPALPGVSIGHNEAGAWGLTIFSVDQEDLYVYDVSRRNPDLYRYRGEWLRMTKERQSIPVKGRGDVAVTLRYTRHGPVLWVDTANAKAYALRAAWLEVGAAPYLASLRMDQAKSWEEFRRACAYSRTPSENMVWADTAGHIGWQAVGVTPIRRTWFGLLPVPGDGRYEWGGYLPIAELPHASDPQGGFLATANELNAPRDFPVRLGYEWTPPWRVARISEVLGSGRRLTLGDMASLQQDVVAMPARQLLPLLRRVEATSPRSADARRRLLAWDDVMSTGSVAAAIYEFWLEALTRRLIPLLAPGAPADLSRLSSRTVVNALLAPDARFGADPLAGRDSVLSHALDDAVGELTARAGRDMDGWQWGQTALHHATLRHPLSAALGLVPPDSAAADADGPPGGSAPGRPQSPARDDGLALDVGPLPRPGNGETVNATWGMTQSGGASFRIIADLADWDRSLGSNAPGQSGDPRSPHYKDLFRLWATGGYFPVLYSRDRIAAAAGADVTVLAPR